MSRRAPSRFAFFIYGGSLLLHAALGVGAVLIPKPVRTQTVAIELAEAKKKKEPPKLPPAPPPTPPPENKPKPRAAEPVPQAQAKVVQEAKADAPAPVAVGADGFADLGIALGNAGAPGLAVAAPVAAAAAPTATQSAPRRVQQLAPAQGDACADPVVPPKLKIPVVPKYTMQARQAEIEGVVRVEVTVDETGRVVSARVLSGLGYGLDESALDAAKQLVFEPALRCGKPVVGTKKIPFRFEQT